METLKRQRTNEESLLKKSKYIKSQVTQHVTEELEKLKVTSSTHVSDLLLSSKTPKETLKALYNHLSQQPTSFLQEQGPSLVQALVHLRQRWVEKPNSHKKSRLLFYALRLMNLILFRFLKSNSSFLFQKFEILLEQHGTFVSSVSDTFLDSNTNDPRAHQRTQENYELINAIILSLAFLQILSNSNTPLKKPISHHLDFLFLVLGIGRSEWLEVLFGVKSYWEGSKLHGTRLEKEVFLPLFLQILRHRPTYVSQTPQSYLQTLSLAREFLEYLSTALPSKSSDEDSDEDSEGEDNNKSQLRRKLKSLELEIKQEISKFAVPSQLSGVISHLQRITREHKLGLKKGDIAAFSNVTAFMKRAMSKDGAIVLGLAFSVRTVERKMEELKENRKALVKLGPSVWRLKYDDSQQKQVVEVNEEDQEFVVDKAGDQKIRGNLLQNISTLVSSKTSSMNDDDSEEEEEEEVITDYHARNLAGLSGLDDEKKKWIREIVHESDGEEREDDGRDEEIASDDYAAVMKDINKAMQNGLNSRKYKDSTMSVGQDLSDSGEEN